ncbi:MAG: heme biosynthesis protein HemY [Rhodobacteraceae bacterium]|nr:heme biosynthesis protein HemY [Paracoccaceae bacterium]
MIRVLFFFALLFAVTLGFAWMADLPGVVSISWGGYVWEQPPVIAVVLASVGFLLLFGLGWLIVTLLRSPSLIARFFGRRRRKKGYSALSHGLIALGSGDIKRARRLGLDADRFLSNEPATKLLLAQTAQLAGRDAEARERFEDMLHEDETKLLGLHGLFIEAERQGEPVAALHYAEEAAKKKPDLEWAGKAVLGYQAVASHWEDALETLQRNYSAKMMDKKTYRRHRAVLLTALAQELESGAPDRAYTLAKEAHGLANDLVPAALVAARLATRRAEFRKGSKIVETTWRISPHPDLAETYAHIKTGDSARDRLKRMKYLKSQRHDSADGALAFARAALEAREFDEARSELKEVLQNAPVRAAFLLMAELDEAEYGDRGRVREWLARAVNAPMDKAWIADGIVSREWQPVSPVTGRLDAFEWQTPPDGQADDDGALVLEEAMFEAPPALTVMSAEDMDDVSGEHDLDATKVLDVEHEPASAKGVDADLAKAAEAKKAEAAKAEAATVAAKQAEAKQAELKKAEAAKREAQKAEAAKVETQSAKKTEQAAKPAVAATSEPDESAVKASSVEGAATEKSATSEKSETPEKPEAQAKESQPSQKPDETKNAPSERQAPIPIDMVVDADDDEDDLGKPISLPFGRMPDDPGPQDEDDDQPPKPRLFN